VSRKTKLRGHTTEQFFPGRVAISIEVNESFDVRLQVYSLSRGKEPFPLISNEVLEASTTVQERSVEIEENSLKIR
jgi:hypothetical protein